MQPLANVVWYVWRIPNAVFGFIHDLALSISIAFLVEPVITIADCVMEGSIEAMEFMCAAGTRSSTGSSPLWRKRTLVVPRSRRANSPVPYAGFSVRTPFQRRRYTERQMKTRIGRTGPMKNHEENEAREMPIWPKKVAYVALAGLAYYVADRVVRRKTQRHIHEHVLDALENPTQEPAEERLGPRGAGLGS